MSAQPVWKLVANLGDVHPLEYGGYFVYRDETGVYPPEAHRIEMVDDSLDVTDTAARWEVHTIQLETCTYRDGILSDNRFHPEMPAWFAAPESRRAERPQDSTYLSNVADSCGMDECELIDSLCAGEPVAMAKAYRDIADYHGWENFDSYPLTLTLAEVKARYPEFA